MSEPNETTSLFETLEPSAKQQLVRLVVAGMPTVMMADFLQLSVSDTQNLLNEPELKRMVAAQNAKEAVTGLQNAASWDKVEELALRNVISELNSRPDPEFALRAASAANKAIRQHRNSTAGATQVELNSGAKIITLSLNQNVVQNLLNVQPSGSSSNIPEDGKIVDMFTSHDMDRLSYSGQMGVEQKVFDIAAESVPSLPTPLKRMASSAESENGAYKFDFDAAFDKLEVK